MKKLHWYNLSFMWGTDGQAHYNSVYHGTQFQFVNVPSIKNAKKEAKIPESATLLNASYLGYMTEEAFKTNGE